MIPSRVLICGKLVGNIGLCRQRLLNSRCRNLQRVSSQFAAEDEVTDPTKVRVYLGLRRRATFPV